MKGPSLLLKLSAITFTFGAMSTYVAFKAGAFTDDTSTVFYFEDPPDSLKKDSLFQDSLQKIMIMSTSKSAMPDDHFRVRAYQPDLDSELFMNSSKSDGGSLFDDSALWKDLEFMGTSKSLSISPDDLDLYKSALEQDSLRKLKLDSTRKADEEYIRKEQYRKAKNSPTFMGSSKSVRSSYSPKTDTLRRVKDSTKTDVKPTHSNGKSKSPNSK